MRATKIVATVGPASASKDVLAGMLDAGVDVLRFNLSHGDPAEHAARIRLARALESKAGRTIGILVDLPGPKIRLGKFEGGGCDLETGRRFTITVEPVAGNCERASTTYPLFARDVKPGDRVLLNDGAVELRVLSADGVEAECEVVSGGPVGDRKGINLPGVRISSPAFTDRDRAALEAMLREPVDLIALSFVRSAGDVAELRRFLDERERRAPIVAKIEKPEAWDNLDGILEEADGVMVARGDLGVEVELEKVPYIQKAAITRARMRGRFAITATQMLESMIESAVPTRAEVSDVANAIADGTDALMLSAETSVGKHPVEAVRWMARIAEEAEAPERRLVPPELAPGPNRTHADLIADAAYEAAQSRTVDAIVVFTMSGASARLAARYRPPVPIFAFTPSGAVARQLAVVSGVCPIESPEGQSTDEIMAGLERILIERRLVRPGASVAVVAGLPPGRSGNTNLLKLHRIG